ncbi:uncharacterized protein LOC120736091 [Simochromis diagramma]|uniref:uncharacterized protein LOC120736091 n=1 Tax=Simochromis diagramma TaxID=43689 RepID=UPI001A7ECE64|nr:uncharacterized protein LOC120736091 [Simochromis diagramma]
MHLDIGQPSNNRTSPHQMVEAVQEQKPIQDGTQPADECQPRPISECTMGCAEDCRAIVTSDVRARINAASLKWRQVTGVLCDRRMPDRLKGKIYKTVVYPVALYGSTCLPALTTHEQALNTMEMRMLRWSLGITRRDRVTIEDIQKRLGVAPIKENMLKSRLRWYGHVIRSYENSVAKTAMMIDPEGCQPRGRPQKRWMAKIKEDIKTVNASPEDALDRTKWRNLCGRADPASAGTTPG